MRTPAADHTFASLGADVVTAADALWTRGVRPRSVVAIDLPDPAQYLAALLATDLIRAIPLVCDPSWGVEQRSAVLGAVAPDVHIDGWPIAATSQPSDTDTRRGPELDTLARLAAQGLGRFTDRVGPAAPDDHAWAGFSSGSTGRPRAIVRTRASWTASFGAAAKLTGLNGGVDTVLVPGPLASSLYCFAALHGLAEGCTVVLTGRWSGRLIRPHLPHVDLVHVVPHQLGVLLDDLEVSGPGRLRTAVVGGAGLPAGLRERAARGGVDVVEYYGAVELSFVAVDPDGSGLRPFDQVEIDIRPVPGGTDLGEVWVRSPWVAHDYLAGARGPFRSDGTGWVSVGDLAEIGAPGAPLRLRGRGDGAVLTGGATVVPEDVEVVLAGVPGVNGVVVVGTPHHRLGAVVTAVIETGAESVPRVALESAARRGLMPAQRPRRWFEIDQLPRTGSGKPARAAITEGLLRGGLGVRPVR